MMDKHYVSAIFDDKTVSLTDEFKMRLSEITPFQVVYKDNSTSMSGNGGITPHEKNFDSGQIAFKFKLIAQDNYDYHLAVQDIKSMLNRRGIYYITHSKLPYIKYAVDKCDVSLNRISAERGDVTLVFNVFKGYGESMLTTAEIHKKPNAWAFGGNLITNNKLVYTHTKNEFTIENLSDDPLDPRSHVYLKIELKGTPIAGKDITLTNKTTGDKFIFYASKNTFKKTDKLVLEGVYARLNGNLAGIKTNHGLIGLTKGSNDFSLSGLTQSTVTFDFNFVYR